MPVTVKNITVSKNFHTSTPGPEREYNGLTLSLLTGGGSGMAKAISV